MTSVPVKKKIRSSEVGPTASRGPPAAESSAGRSVLNNADIVCRITALIDEGPDLARLARTSKAFFLPSAERLWCWLDADALQKLLNLLPSRLTSTSSSEESFHSQYGYSGSRSLGHGNIPGGVLRKSDVERWKIYSPMVQTIELGFASNAVVGQALIAFRTLVGILPGILLLPCLEMITFTYASGYIQMAQLLLSPSVRYVRISQPLTGTRNPPISSPLVCSFLEWLPDRAPHVIQLHMGEADLKVDVVDEICQCIRRLPHLEDINIGCTTREEPRSSQDDPIELGPVKTAHEIMKAAFELENIQRLSIKEWASESKDGAANARPFRLPMNYPRDAFKQLKSLQITAPMDFCGALIKRCSPPLTSIQVTCPSTPTLDTNKSFVAATLHSCPDLHDLVIILGGRDATAQWTSFHPLLDLPLFAFTITSVKGGNPFHFDDDALLAMAKAWPNLRSLNIDTRETLHEQDPCITFSGLLRLARHCRVLQSLKIGYLGASQMDRAEVVIQVGTLDRFHVRWTTESAVRLAEFIAAVWPNAVVGGLEQRSPTGSLLRDEVNNILTVVSAARRFDRGSTALMM